MANKEDLHKLKFSVMVAPISEAPNTKMAAATAGSCLDTQGFESNMFVLTFGVAAGVNGVYALYDNDTSTTTAGTIVTGRNVIFAVADNTAAYLGTGTLANNTYPAVGQWVQSTGTFTPTTACTGKQFLFAYTGNKRYVRLYASAGDSAIYTLTAVQGHFRYAGRGGLYVEPYAAEA
jgi:hypothetical protein